MKISIMEHRAAGRSVKQAKVKLKRAFTTHQVADFCGCHFTSVIRWITAGKLKAYKTLGGHRRILGTDLVAFMSTYEIPVPSELVGYAVEAGKQAVGAS